MDMRDRKKLCLAVITALGATAAIHQPAAAAVIADGNYQISILTTPFTVFQGSTIYLAGSDGAWNSTFTLGTLPGGSSQTMTDNGASATGSDAVARGSSLAGDGYAGTINITVTGGSFTVSSFQVDAIFATCCGMFVQYTDLSIQPVAMNGTIDQTTGAMTFDPTGRLGAFSAINTFFDRRWNVDDLTTPCSSTTGCASNGNTVYSMFTTGAATNSSGTINGAPLTAIGDVNFDSLTDYQAILVSGAMIGADWGGLAGVSYFETWEVTMLSFHGDPPPVPIPATAWLFGSGLLGLASLARRKRCRE